MSIHSFQYGPSMKSTHTFDLAGVSARVERYRINWRRCLVPLWSSTLLNVRNWRFTSCLQRSSSSTSTDETASLKEIISKERGGGTLRDGAFHGTKLGNSQNLSASSQYWHGTAGIQPWKCLILPGCGIRAFLISFEFATLKSVVGAETIELAFWRVPLEKTVGRCSKVGRAITTPERCVDEFQNSFSFSSAVMYSLLPYSQCISKASWFVIISAFFCILSLLCANES